MFFSNWSTGLRLGRDCHGDRRASGELPAEGKLFNLTQRFEAAVATGLCGIGHTRCATHGDPEERNAHPHLDGLYWVAVVHTVCGVAYAARL
jgi:hypothetical protein